jgi:hypothetical protein
MYIPRFKHLHLRYFTQLNPSPLAHLQYRGRCPPCACSSVQFTAGRKGSHVCCCVCNRACGRHVVNAGQSKYGAAVHRWDCVSEIPALSRYIGMTELMLG